MSTKDQETLSIRHAGAPTNIQPFVDVIACLRAPDGCPWDLKQTHLSLKRFAVEEVYELTEAIDAGEDEALCEELGDVLLQVALHAQLASERGAFAMQDVCDGIRDKMLRRHPHVFSPDGGLTAEEVETNWKASKRAEGKSTLGGVPRTMPSLERADRISRRAASVGFDFPTAADAFDKVREEFGELEAALKSEDLAAIRDELGDAIFSLANLARKLDIDASESLRGTMEKFESRFAYIEESLARQGRSAEDASLEEMESLWQRAKNRR
jgi:tetrapyrrole methylase family protein/MazG family protein